MFIELITEMTTNFQIFGTFWQSKAHWQIITGWYDTFWNNRPTGPCHISLDIIYYITSAWSVHPVWLYIFKVATKIRITYFCCHFQPLLAYKIGHRCQIGTKFSEQSSSHPFDDPENFSLIGLASLAVHF